MSSTEARFKKDHQKHPSGRSRQSSTSLTCKSGLAHSLVLVSSLMHLTDKPSSPDGEGTLPLSRQPDHAGLLQGSCRYLVSLRWPGWLTGISVTQKKVKTSFWLVNNRFRFCLTSLPSDCWGFKMTQPTPYYSFSFPFAVWTGKWLAVWGGHWMLE